jgi:MFS family permease
LPGTPTTSETTAALPTGRSTSSRLWQNLTVRLAVALAFADASIVVLALPQVVARLHTSISHVTWVIMAYNLALIVACAIVIPFARRLASAKALVAGLVVFGLASIGCGVADSMGVLVPFRCLQGLGGGLLVAASLPVFASLARPGDSPLNGWSAAAAVGMAVGPALGGVLTQLFDWRSIFLAQAPVAAAAAILVLAEHLRTPTEAEVEVELDVDAEQRSSVLDPLTANISLLLLSAGLICALFLAVIALINVWLLTPLAAAAVVSVLPIVTAIAERAVRGNSPMLLAAIGSLAVAVGLFGMGLVTHKQLGVVVPALALCGLGLGLAFPGLTVAALRTSGPAAARAAKTTAARDGGILIGLLILTPVFVDQLNSAPNKAITSATKAVLSAPLPLTMKLGMAPGLIHAYKVAPQSELPNFAPAFEQMSAIATPTQRVALIDLQARIDSIVQHAATSAFKVPFRDGAIFALLVLPVLGFRLLYVRRRPSTDRADATDEAASPR